MPIHDGAERRKLQSHGRQKGGRVYIPLDVLNACGYNPEEGPIYYRTLPGKRGAVMIQLYREPMGYPVN